MRCKRLGRHQRPGVTNASPGTSRCHAASPTARRSRSLPSQACCCSQGHAAACCSAAGMAQPAGAGAARWEKLAGGRRHPGGQFCSSARSSLVFFYARQTSIEYDAAWSELRGGRPTCVNSLSALLGSGHVQFRLASAQVLPRPAARVSVLSNHRTPQHAAGVSADS